MANGELFSLSGVWGGLCSGLLLGLAAGHLTRGGRTPWGLYWLRRRSAPSSGGTSLEGDQSQMKVALVVRMDLGMKKGKMAAQCSHAALAVYRLATRHHPHLLASWEAQGEPMIVLKSDEKGEEALLTLYNRAVNSGLPSAFIKDAGLTQIPRGSLTVLAIGPAPSATIDPIVKHLKLL